VTRDAEAVIKLYTEVQGVTVPPEIVNGIENDTMEIEVKNKTLQFQVKSRETGMGTFRLWLNYQNSLSLTSS
jgi:hypothetical protein